jgi:hypothetical protein
MQPTEYIELLKNGGSDKVEGLCGRIIRGKTPQCFSRLSDDPNRKVVMLTDSEGLQSLLGKNGYDMLITIGHHPDHIAKCLSEGKSYKIVVFPASSALEGTWDGVIRLGSQVYPDVAPFLKKYRPEFARLPFSVIEQMAGYKFKDADDPRFMSHENFNKRQSKGLAAVRALLYHTLHLRELFRGDGYTYDEKGNRGVREYLLPNVEVTSISGVVVHDLTVSRP